MKNRKNILFFLLPVIAAVCIWIWVWADTSYTPEASDNGTWDLRGTDFGSSSMNLIGAVEYIPGVLLSPEEFSAKEDEAVTGHPHEAAAYSTSRIRILVPPGTYGLMGYSSEFASRVFINGILAESVGAPGSAADTSSPGIKLLFYTAEAPNGVIEIVQQASNYVYHTGDGSHANIVVGTPDAIRGIYTRQITHASVVLGCFFALALAHFVLYFLYRSYKANLWFMLFCATWFIRTGLTGPKILPMLLPLNWYAAFRLEYLTVPAGTLLVCMTLHALFPGVLQRWFPRALAVACGACTCVCLFANTVFMSETMPYFYIVVFLASAYVVARLCMKLRKPDAEQIAVLIGMGVFLYCALRDILYFSGINIFPLADRSIAEVALLIFVFSQMAAMFHGTMREVAAAKEREMQHIAEKAALETQNQRMAEQNKHARELLRRVESTPEQILTHGSLTLDVVSTQAFIDGTPLRLSHREFAALFLLAQNEDKAVSAEYVYEKAWGLPMAGDKNTVHATISRLRKKIQPAGYDIKAIRGQGYVFRKHE